jgi:crotonobetaine/carnitine-CoA ligase
MKTSRASRAPPERTLPALLQRQARRYGDKPLVAVAGAAWTYRDAMQVAARRGAALRAAGVGRGERVAILCGNRAEFLEAFLGCGWIGAVAVPINAASMGPQIGYVLADSGARLLVVEGEFAPRLEHAELSRSALRSIWVVGEGAAIDVPCAIEPWPAAQEAIEPEALRPGDALAILYTSGTTGPAKGVQCPHAQYAWWGANSARILGLTERDVLATTLPLFHINALNTLAQALVAGCRVAYEARFSASRFWSAMAAAEATVVYLLGAMVPMLLAQPPTSAERAHRVRVGLAPGAPEAAMQAFHRRCGVPLIDGYGSTETNFVIAGALDAPRRGVMGWLQPDFDARVVDEEDAEVAAGVAGELVLRADEPFAFASGYFGRPEQTLAAWRNLWFHTGDRVVREADGAFRFVDRIKDAIRRRGENISSWEVEQVLLGHASVAEAAVFPVRSELAEDEVMAALVARPGARIDPAGLCAFCAARLPRFAVPRYIDVVAELPRTENGKVRKVVLRERGVTAATWDRARGE